MLPPEAKAAYVIDGKFSNAAFVGRFNQVLQEEAPYADMLKLEHHKWYRFGLSYCTE